MQYQLSHSDYVIISKYMSYILRHRPENASITLDEMGYVVIDALLRALQKRWAWLTVNDIHEICDRSEKQRYEINGDRIRAKYGHSVKVEADLKVVKPPDVLYHGTSNKALKYIIKSGLRPMNRQYVHLSSSFNEAKAVGRRKDRKPRILHIDAKRAHKDGVQFQESNTIYLVKKIKPRYIAKIE